MVKLASPPVRLFFDRFSVDAEEVLGDRKALRHAEAELAKRRETEQATNARAQAEFDSTVQAFTELTGARPYTPALTKPSEKRLDRLHDRAKDFHDDIADAHRAIHRRLHEGFEGVDDAYDAMHHFVDDDRFQGRAVVPYARESLRNFIATRGDRMDLKGALSASDLAETEPAFATVFSVDPEYASAAFHQMIHVAAAEQGLRHAQTAARFADERREQVRTAFGAFQAARDRAEDAIDAFEDAVDQSDEAHDVARAWREELAEDSADLREKLHDARRDHAELDGEIQAMEQALNG